MVLKRLFCEKCDDIRWFLPFFMLAVRICVLCAEYSDLPKDKSALDVLHKHAQFNIDWSVPLKYFYSLRDVNPNEHEFRATCERRGDQTFKSPEAAAAFGGGVNDALGWKVNLKKFNTEIYIEIDGGFAVVGIVLFAEMHKRNRADHSGSWKTALNSSFAYCLARYIDIKMGQCVCDPMCGIGTIPIESALEWKSAKYICGDIDGASIQVARENARLTNANVDFFVWDATKLPLVSHSVDVIVTDLPFGHRHGSFRTNQSLYPKSFSEWHRILKPKGMLYVVTTERGIMKRYLESHQKHWTLLKSIVVDIGGFNAELYSIQCEAGPSGLLVSLLNEIPQIKSTGPANIISSMLHEECEVTPQLRYQFSSDASATSPTSIIIPGHSENSAQNLPQLKLNSSAESYYVPPSNPPLLNSISSTSFSPQFRPALVLEKSPSLLGVAPYMNVHPKTVSSQFSPNLALSHKRPGSEVVAAVIVEHSEEKKLKLNSD